jgi:hypothetical protein
MTGASAGEKPLLAGLEALLNGLQSSLAHRAALKAANRGHTDIKLLGAVAGGQAQGRAGLDARQDLEAHSQEGGYREAGVALKPRSLQVPAWPLPQQTVS